MNEITESRFSFDNSKVSTATEKHAFATLQAQFADLRKLYAEKCEECRTQDHHIGALAQKLESIRTFVESLPQTDETLEAVRSSWIDG